ncbi:hypothetical protein MBLNU459_g8550t1 [Dothideomycetes sp. NU459]
MGSLQTTLQYLGGASAAFIAYKLATFAWIYLRPSSLHRYHHGEPGSKWALVTGASDGIGQGFAESLSAEGFNVLLHGRNPEKLAGVKERLEKRFPALQYRIVTADAFDQQVDLEKIASAARGLPGKLTILVNNVGGQPLEPNFPCMTEIEASYVDKIINLNARFPIQLTAALLPLLSTNSPSLVMNVSSMAGVMGVPYLTVYSCSKAFNYCFSQALKAELAAEGHDIEVLGIIVGNVISNSNKVHRAGFTCTSSQLASEALARVGSGDSNVWAWYRHALQGNMMLMMPEPLIHLALGKAMKEQKAASEKTKEQ